MAISRGTTVRFARPDRNHEQRRPYAVLDPVKALVIETWRAQVDAPGVSAGDICFGNEPFVVDPTVLETAEIDKRFPVPNLPREW